MLPPLSPEQLIKPRYFEARIGLLYAAVFIPNGIHLPYFPLWLEDSGFRPEQIAVVLSAPLFVRIAAGPTVSALADRAPDRVPVMTAIAALTAAVACGYFLTPSYALVLAVSLVLAVVWAPHSPVADSIAQSGVRRYASDYAKMRVWGSISFLLTNIAAGWILTRTGAGAVPWLLLAGLLAVVGAAAVAPRLGRPRQRALSPAEALPKAAAALAGAYFLVFVAAASIAQSSHALLYSFGSIYWRSVGIGETAVGFLWAFSVVMEVLMFGLFRRLFGTLRSPLVLAIGSGIAALRWAAYPLVEPAGLGLPGFFAVQALHAFSFSLVFLGMQKMIGETVPEERMGAAQGIAFFITGAMMAALTLLSGPLYKAFGAGAFYAMSAVSATALAFAVVSYRLEKR
jgi:PPP family 3-phenylpropionic acid transporter